jgi:hypothetical protein
MLDFSKLCRPTALERLEDDQRRRDAAIADDHARRVLRARKTVIITLTHDPEARFAISGASVLHLFGEQTNGREARAAWYAPDHMTREDFDAIAARYAIGSTLELRGYWKPFEAKSGTRFTFIAQFVTEVAQRLRRKSPDAEIEAFG